MPKIEDRDQFPAMTDAQWREFCEVRVHRYVFSGGAGRGKGKRIATYRALEGLGLVRIEYFEWERGRDGWKAHLRNPDHYVGL